MEDLKDYLSSVKDQLKSGELTTQKEIPPPWQHQIEAVKRATKLDCFGFFFEVGCGKTRALVDTIEHQYESHKRVLRTLILCPLIVVENFKREINYFGRISKQKVGTLTGKSADKIAALKEGHPILITNYETLLNKQIAGAIEAWNPEIVVADELHKLKNPTSVRTKRCIYLSKKAKYRYGLSGTPILNSEMDLFSQILFLDHGKALGSNFFVFRSQYFYDVNAGRKGTHSYFPMWEPRPNILPKLKALIELFTMSVKKSDALDLPPFVVKEIPLEMEQEQKRCYEDMKKGFVAYLKDKACVAELAITKALRLLQITSGFIKFEDDTESAFAPNPKTMIAEKLLEEITPNHKVIIWCVFKNNYAELERLCARLKLNYAMIHGEVKDKQAEIDRFQKDENCRVMIANPSAGGIGISLIAASYMIYYSKNFNLGDDVQSEARAYRGGSERHESITRIDLIAKDSIDELVHKVLKEKKQLADSIMSQSEVYMRLRREMGV